MSKDAKTEHEQLEEENGELLPDREVMTRVWPDPDPVLIEPDTKTYEVSPEDPPPGT
jgi:hypothetical protein